MIAALSLIVRYWKIGAAVIIAVAIGYSYLWTYNAGKSSVYDKLKSERLTILKDGKRIDEKVFKADDDMLCALLGGCGMRSDNANN